jgi:hypothetical protein
MIASVSMSRKRIQCFADFPFAQYPDAKVPWDDVYLRWKGKPGRRVYRAAPCLECEAELKMDLKIHEDIRQRYNGEHDDWYRKEDADYQRVLAELAVADYAASGEGAGLCIYTKSHGIDKHEAERMLAWWLNRTHGIRNPKFVWNRPKFIVTPMGFGEYPE